VSLLLALACLAFAHGFRPQSAACSACGGTGRVPCSEHRSADLVLERGVVLCGFYAGCARCGGRTSVDCAACEHAEDEAEKSLAKLREHVAARFARYDAVLGRRVMAGASAHFNLVCELEPMKAQRKRRGPHELLHLYLERLEEVHRAYLELFALGEADVTARSEVFLWKEQADHLRAGQEFCGYTTADPEYMRGLEAITSIWLDPRKMEGDEALHRNVVHHAVHGIMNVQPPVGWTGKLRMGWADEGLSLWFEDRLTGAATGFCFWPEEELKGLRGGLWRPAVRKMLESDAALDFERFLELDTVDMTREEQALGFALVDHLAARDPVLLNRLLGRLRARTPARDAFKELYGLTLAGLEAGWRRWVLASYPRR
jgi:hypothetical protein